MMEFENTGTVTLKGIIDEDFVNYKFPSMTLMFPRCSFKCGKDVCQNKDLIDMPNITVDVDSLVNRYVNNDITKAIVFQGLEPFDSFPEMWFLIDALRKQTSDDIVIYTGHNENQIGLFCFMLHDYQNIIVKFGQYMPGDKPHRDPILEVDLASDNQYAKKIS